MKLIIGGDIVPTSTNIDLFIRGDVDTLIGSELKSVLNEANYKVFNLETPLVNQKSPIKKSGPSLIASPETIEALKQLGVNLVTLANNHILDQGEKGLESTIKTLETAQISWIGVGYNNKNICSSRIVEIEGRKIGFYACAEHEFSIVGNLQPGANPFDARISLTDISQLKKKCDYLIVLYHGGKEEYRYPTPELQKSCRSAVDAGADLVLCQHSHCIGCEEEYHGSRIVYGQGNFIFDESECELWKTSLLLSINEKYEIDYCPIVKYGNKIRLAEEKERKDILKEFKDRSESIKKENFIADSFDLLCKEKENMYLLRLLGVNRNSLIFRLFNKISMRKWESFIIKRKLNNKYILTLINFIECEPHRELLISMLKKRV